MTGELLPIGDGWTVELELVPPRTACPQLPVTLLCGPAMMADRRTLDRPRGAGFASFFARLGYRVYTFDFRGHGRSGPRASPTVDWSYDDLVRVDMPHLVREVSRRDPGHDLVLVGHSLAGHVAAAAVALQLARSVAALVLLSTNVWLRSLDPSPLRWLVKRGLLAAWNALTAARGYFPARALRVGPIDEPRRYVAQFARWAAEGRWSDERGEIDYLARMADVRCDVLSIAGRGDRLYCAPACARRFAAAFTGARVDCWEIAADAIGGAAHPTHMSLVTETRSAPLWRAIDGWLRQRLPR